MREVNECLVCNVRSLQFFSKKDGYLFSQCHHCQLIFVNPLPNPEDLINNFYSKESGYHREVVRDLTKIKQFSKKFSVVLRGLIHAEVEGNLLDVGCANGEFLELAKRHGFTAYGVEANAYTADLAIKSGLNVFVGTLEQAHFESHYFSAIYLGDIIEHVVDPTALLKECKRILRPGGVIAISTPNTNCFWVKATGFLCQRFAFPWSVLIPPYHLYLFSDINIKQYLEKLDFTVVETLYGGVSLRHELGGTGLIKKYKKQKSIAALLYMVVVFLAYASMYILNLLATLLLRKDFEMIIFAKRSAS